MIRFMRQHWPTILSSKVRSYQPSIVVDHTVTEIFARGLLLSSVLSVSVVQLVIFFSGEVASDSDFYRYIVRYVYAEQPSLAPESLFYYAGHKLGGVFGYWEYQIALAYISVLLFVGLIARKKSDVVFIGNCLFIITFIGFDVFFSAVRSTLAAIVFCMFWRFMIATPLLYFVHLGVMLQSALNLILVRARIIPLIILVVAGLVLWSQEIGVLAWGYYRRFSEFEGQSALAGYYNVIFIVFYLAHRFAFDFAEKKLLLMMDFLFIVYVVMAVIGLPYAYRLSYFPIILQQVFMVRFSGNMSGFLVYLAFMFGYVALSIFRIT